VLAGFGVFTGAVWARTIGVIMAIVSGIAAFAWLPWYPIWGVAIIVCAIGVIWALTAHGRDVERLQE
jgi:cell division protein FtsX